MSVNKHALEDGGGRDGNADAGYCHHVSGND